MKDLENILEFSIHLGRKMLESGANLERINDTLTRICYSYKLRDVSLFSLNSTLILSARNEAGHYCTRHIAVPDTGIELGHLNQYNQLSRDICIELPPPSKLQDRLDKLDYQIRREQGIGIYGNYPVWMTLLGYILALSCICLLSGGTIRDMLCVAISTVVMFFCNRLLALPSLNRIIKNAICMFIAGCLALFFTRIGLAENYYVIILTNAFMLIPGIPMVNAVRNILCRNEITGIIELIKVVLETLSIVVGLVVSMFFFAPYVL